MNEGVAARLSRILTGFLVAEGFLITILGASVLSASLAARPVPVDLVATLTLIFLLILRELCGELEVSWARSLTRISLAGIVPLLLVFMATSAGRIAGALSPAAATTVPSSTGDLQGPQLLLAALGVLAVVLRLLRRRWAEE